MLRETIRIAILFLFLCVAAGLHAQKTIRILDEQTKVPIMGAVVADDEHQLTLSDRDGMAVVPQRDSTKVIYIAHELYGREEFLWSDLPETVLLTHRDYILDEVQVNAQKRAVDPKAFQYKVDPTTAQLQAAGNGNGNLLAPLVKLISKWTSKKKKHAKTFKEIMDEY